MLAVPPVIGPLSMLGAETTMPSSTIATCRCGEPWAVLDASVVTSANCLEPCDLNFRLTCQLLCPCVGSGGTASAVETWRPSTRTGPRMYLNEPSCSHAATHFFLGSSAPATCLLAPEQLSCWNCLMT